MHAMRGLLLVAVVGLFGSVARAQPTPDAAPSPDAPAPDVAPDVAPPHDVAPALTPEAAIEPAPPAAIDWQAAPLPTESSGEERAAPTPAAHHLLWIPRVVLFVPRWSFWLVMQPVRGAAYLWERYQLGDRFKGVFFNTDQTFGLYPVVTIQSGFGINVGARMVHKDLFGKRERIKLGAGFGGRYSQLYSASVKSGQRFGSRIEAGLELRYERRPRERFFGIGNDDQIEPVPGMPLIDPTMADLAVDTRFREHLVRGMLTLDAQVYGDISAHLSAAYLRLRFDDVDDDEADIESYYDVSRLPGYETGVTNLYIEGELRYDSRRATSKWESQAIDATGWLVSGYVGGVTGLDDDPNDFYRYGGEVQRYFDLYRGTRVLALRAMVEATGGPNGRNEISFVDLPRLGGNEFLRGYATDRFRDRASTLVTAEYNWSLGNYVAGYLFADVGRVWPRLRDVALEELRVGYGGGVQFHSRNSYLMRLQVALSRDNDVFFELALSPTFDRRERAGRF
jgi:hypothetical protein